MRNTKRIIFTLIYDRGFFMHSRNFRLQRAGNSDWIIKNYNFQEMSRHVDELIFLDVSRESYSEIKTKEDFKLVTDCCFVPVSFGGKLRTIEQVKDRFKNGADKVVLNTAIFKDPDFVKEVSKIFGVQSIVASLDVSLQNNKYIVYVENGTESTDLELEKYLELEIIKHVGEIYLNSIDKDGTGQGYDIGIARKINERLKIPIIFAGGAGNSAHFVQLLSESKIDALATANLFNFVGDGLAKSRESLIESGHDFPQWDADFINDSRNASKRK